MKTKVKQYLETYDDQGHYVTKVVDYDDQQLPKHIIKGNINETFDDHNYITEQPYHDNTKLPYTDWTSKTFTIQYPESDISVAITNLNHQITEYIANVNHSLTQFEHGGVGRISDHYQIKIETINESTTATIIKTVSFIRK